MTEAPWPVSNKDLNIDVSGYLMPCHEDRQPVLIGMHGTNDLFICLYSTEDKLRQSFLDWNIEFARIVIIMDGNTFVDSIKEDIALKERSYELRIAVDPHKTERGTVRYQEIWLKGRN